MKQKFIKGIFVTVISFTAFCMKADTETVNGITWEYIVSDGKASIGSGISLEPAIPSSTSGSITVPSTLGGYPVTSIGDYAFSWCSSIKSVTIPDSITSIGQQAFYECSLLERVTIPDSVTNIGIRAFYKCKNMVDNNGFVIVRGVLYYYCGTERDVLIPNSVISIGADAFLGCCALKSVTIPNSVKNIGERAFYGCTSLPNVTIPDSVISIGKAAFYGCDSLTSVTIPDSVVSMGDSVFCSCSLLQNIIVEIDNASYKSEDGMLLSKDGTVLITCPCAKMSMTIPNGVTSIEGDAFYGCWLLEHVTIPDSVTNIGVRAFCNCDSLTSVTIGDSVTHIGDGAFYGCKGLADSNGFVIVCGVLYYYCGRERDVIIPENVMIIGGDAFSYCSSLTRVTIPNSVTSIREGAFSHCSSLANITIPNSVTNVGMHAFYGCTPKEVTVPGWKSGVNFSSVTNLIISDGVTSIKERAFYGCSSLESVTIPAGVTSIGFGAFSACDSLTSVIIPNSVTSMGDKAFYGCQGLSDSNGFVIVNSMLYCYYGTNCNVTVPDGIINICSEAFSYCSSLKSVTIPDSVTSIGYKVFFHCTSLERVIIPNSVTNVGTYAFYGCTPKEVTVPGWKSGVDFSSVTNLIISEGTTSVPDWEFCGCDSLISVTIPASVTSIGYGAFSACNSLTSVIFEGNAPSVSDYDFYKADSTCTAFVKRASTGWGVAIPGRWNGLYIQYIDFTPAPDSEPNPESTPDPAPIPKPEPVPMPELGDGGYEVGGDDIGTSIPEYAASVYDGYVYSGNKVVGTIQAKVAKPKDDIAKVTATIQITGEKKVSIKDELESGELYSVAKDGRELKLNFGYEGMKGTFGVYEIDGARNFFSSKDKAEKANAEAKLNPWLGTINMSLENGVLAVTIAKKGKVTVKGTVQGGTKSVKVSAKAQALVGEKWICIPVTYSKSGVNLAFTLWLNKEIESVEVVGLDGDPKVGMPGKLEAGAVFNIDQDILIDIETDDDATLELLPIGERVSVNDSGKKWIVADGAKAAKVAYKDDKLIVTPGNKKDKDAVNPSGLKLTYKAKDGSFKGSFTAYAIVKGKLKKHKATVEGGLVNGIGYGTATIKKVGTWAVTIE